MYLVSECVTSVTAPNCHTLDYIPISQTQGSIKIGDTGLTWPAPATLSCLTWQQRDVETSHSGSGLPVRECHHNLGSDTTSSSPSQWQISLHSRNIQPLWICTDLEEASGHSWELPSNRDWGMWGQGPDVRYWIYLESPLPVSHNSPPPWSASHYFAA